MFFRHSPEKFFNLVASKYATSPIADVAAYERKIETLKTYLSAEQQILDIGCGTGTQCHDLASSVDHVTGIDLSHKLLAIAEQRTTERAIDNVVFFETNVFDSHFKANNFDAVMAFYVLHFCENIDDMMRRINNLLRPDGLFVLETACLGENNKVVAKLIRLTGKLGFLPLINVLTTKQIEQALEKAGFILIEKTQFSGSNNEYTLIARKAT